MVDIPVFYAYGISVYIVFYQVPFSFISFNTGTVTFNVGGRRQRNKDLLRLDFRKLFHFFYSEMSMMPTVNRMDDLITTVRKC